MPTLFSNLAISYGTFWEPIKNTKIEKQERSGREIPWIDFGGERERGNIKGSNGFDFARMKREGKGEGGGGKWPWGVLLPAGACWQSGWRKVCGMWKMKMVSGKSRTLNLLWGYGGFRVSVLNFSM